MAQKVITMDVKLAAALAAGLESVNVSALARDLGLSRRWVYELARRYAADGIGGLEGRSRRPKRSPNQVPSEVEDEIVAWHHHRSGLGVLPRRRATPRASGPCAQRQRARVLRQTARRRRAL